MIKAGGRTICSGFHKLINSIWHKEELPDKRDYGNYKGIPLLSTM